MKLVGHEFIALLIFNFGAEPKRRPAVYFIFFLPPVKKGVEKLL